MMSGRCPYSIPTRWSEAEYGSMTVLIFSIASNCRGVSFVCAYSGNRAASDDSVGPEGFSMSILARAGIRPLSSNWNPARLICVSTSWATMSFCDSPTCRIRARLRIAGVISASEVTPTPAFCDCSRMTFWIRSSLVSPSLFSPSPRGSPLGCDLGRAAQAAAANPRDGLGRRPTAQSLDDTRGGFCGNDRTCGARGAEWNWREHRNGLKHPASFVGWERRRIGTGDLLSSRRYPLRLGRDGWRWACRNPATRPFLLNRLKPRRRARRHDIREVCWRLQPLPALSAMLLVSRSQELRELRGVGYPRTGAADLLGQLLKLLTGAYAGGLATNRLFVVGRDSIGRLYHLLLSRAKGDGHEAAHARPHTRHRLFGTSRDRKGCVG